MIDPNQWQMPITKPPPEARFLDSQEPRRQLPDDQIPAAWSQHTIHEPQDLRSSGGILALKYGFHTMVHLWTSWLISSIAYCRDEEAAHQGSQCF